MLVLLLLIGSCGANINLDTFEVNEGPLYINFLEKIKLAPTYIENNLPGVWVEPTEVINAPVYIGAQENVALTANINDIQSNIQYAGNLVNVESSDINYIPTYVNSLREIDLAIVNLRKNLLSMSGAIPYLSDPRRDFAEIINVIYQMAKEIGHSLLPIDYETSYRRLINTFAPDGICKPQAVINDVQSGLAKFNSWTNSIQWLIRSVCGDLFNIRVCDYVIHSIVLTQPKKYQAAAKVLFAGYEVAYEFNDRMEEFINLSKCHNAHKVIIENPWKLKTIVHKLANVVRITTTLTNCKMHALN